MNRKKQLILTTLLSLLCMNKVNAACTQEEINAFKKIENEYKITYEFNLSTKDYTVTFRYANTEKYTYYPDYYLVSQKFLGYTENSFTYTGIKPGEYKVDIMGNTTTCQDTMKTITLNLAEYNVYYGDPLCEGIEEFVLCQPTYNKKIDRETFESRVNTYKKNKKEQNEDKENFKEEKNTNIIINYIQNNMIEVLIISIFIILVIITLILMTKSIKKSRRLE